MFQGAKIQASIRKTFIYKIERLLSEGKVVIITDLGVASNGSDYRTTRHDYRLNFRYDSEVQPLQEAQILPSPYCFLPFSEILDLNYNTSFLVGMFFPTRFS